MKRCVPHSPDLVLDHAFGSLASRHAACYSHDSGDTSATMRNDTWRLLTSVLTRVPFFNYIQAQYYDGNISLPGCDKNMPGCAMAAVRHNRPTIIVYGGTIQIGERHVDCPAMGYRKGDPVNISDAFESYGEWSARRLRLRGLGLINAFFLSMNFSRRLCGW